MICMIKSSLKKSTEDFEEFEKSLEEFTPEFVEEITGVPWEQIALIARVLCHEKTSFDLLRHGHNPALARNR